MGGQRHCCRVLVTPWDNLCSHRAWKKADRKFLRGNVVKGWLVKVTPGGHRAVLLVSVQPARSRAEQDAHQHRWALPLAQLGMSWQASGNLLWYLFLSQQIGFILPTDRLRFRNSSVACCNSHGFFLVLLQVWDPNMAQNPPCVAVVGLLFCPTLRSVRNPFGLPVITAPDGRHCCNASAASPAVQSCPRCLLSVGVLVVVSLRKYFSVTSDGFPTAHFSFYWHICFSCIFLRVLSGKHCFPLS